MHEEPPTNGKVVLTTSYGKRRFTQVTSTSSSGLVKPRKRVATSYSSASRATTPMSPFTDSFLAFWSKEATPQALASVGETYQGGDSIYGKPFEDEFSHRLKFAYRGLVGMVVFLSPRQTRSQTPTPRSSSSPSRERTTCTKSIPCLARWSATRSTT